MAKKGPIKWDFRDVSSGLQKIREFLLGRKYVYHNRFMPLISPRSIPVPDIPRGPEHKYSDQWYSRRNALQSVKPPVVAPIAEGFKRAPQSCAKPIAINFPCPPTPGMTWWFDGHCYYEQVPDVCMAPPMSREKPPEKPTPPQCPEPKLPPCATSAPGTCDPCKPLPSKKKTC